MTELPDYNKIVFPDMPPIPLENIVPDASPEVGVTYKHQIVIWSIYEIIHIWSAVENGSEEWSSQ